MTAMRRCRIPRSMSQPGVPSTFVWVGVGTSMPTAVSAIGRTVGPSSIAGGMSDVDGIALHSDQNRIMGNPDASPEHHRASERLLIRTQVEFVSPRAAMLSMQLPIRFCDRVGIE